MPPPHAWSVSHCRVVMPTAQSAVAPQLLLACSIGRVEGRRDEGNANCGHSPPTMTTLCILNLLKPSGYYIYKYMPPGLTLTNSTFCPSSVFIYFVWISEQTAIISLYSINWLVFITETESVYCAVRTVYLTFTNSTFCPHSVFMCFVGSENEQRLFPYTALTDWFL